VAFGVGPDRVLTLAAVEAMHAPDGGGDALGLVFRERPSLADLRLALVPGTVIRFEDDPKAVTEVPARRHQSPQRKRPSSG
jgi:hypothetical protein